MAWNVQLESESGIIRTVYTGVLSEQDCHQATVKSVGLASGPGPHLFLTDVREAEIQLSIADIFYIPNTWETLGTTRRNKLAVLAKETGETDDKLSFFETICRNRGWQIRIFTNSQEATHWLTEHHHPSSQDVQDS